MRGWGLGPPLPLVGRCLVAHFYLVSLNFEDAVLKFGYETFLNEVE